MNSMLMLKLVEIEVHVDLFLIHHRMQSKQAQIKQYRLSGKSLECSWDLVENQTQVLVWRKKRIWRNSFNSYITDNMFLISCFFVCVCVLEHHRTRLVCENERLKLVCKNETVLTIYSATFGHLLHGSPYCPQEPGSHVDMGVEQDPIDQNISCTQIQHSRRTHVVFWLKSPYLMLLTVTNKNRRAKF